MRSMTLPRSAARLTAGAFSLLAAGALLAACGGGGDVAEPAAGGRKEPAATEHPATTDTGEGTGAAEDEAWPDSAAIDSALGQWAGTISVDTLASPGGLPFLISQELYDSSDGLTLDAAGVESTEYLGSHSATCTGEVKVGSSPALCTFTGVEGEDYAGKDLTATVHLVRSGAGNHALLMAVGGGGDHRGHPCW